MRSAFKAAAFLMVSVVMVSPLFAQETVEAIFDARKWKLGSENYNSEKKAMTKEFVLEDQSAENWTELITLQFIEGLQDRVRVSEILDKVQTGMKTACPSVKWITLSQERDNALYTWSIKGCPGQPDQTEIARVLAGQEGMHVWHYASKNPDIDTEKKKEWIDRLALYRLKNA